MKKIIILNKVNQKTYFEVNYIFWLSVPVAQQPFRINPQAASAYSGASAAELTALQNGSVVEFAGKASYLSEVTNAQIGVDLVSKYNAEQSALNADDKFNYFGSFWNGTNWTIQGA
jgi:hypothetical protein